MGVAGSITGSITSFIADHGLYAVFVLMAIDAVFPAASELVMVYAGAVAAGAFGANVHLGGATFATGFEAYVAMAASGTLGYVVGSAAGWAIGRYGGRPLLARHGRWLHLGGDRLDRAERWFDRWDDLAVLVGRLTPVVRSFVSIPAGVFRMTFWRYLVLTLVGSAVWAFAFAGVGWALGTGYERFHHGFRFADYAVAAAAAALVAFVLVRWLPRRPVRSRPHARRPPDSPGALEPAETPDARQETPPPSPDPSRRI